MRREGRHQAKVAEEATGTEKAALSGGFVRTLKVFVD